ncbi:unnamed protein product [Bemisia tabaci]|uniref:Alpha-1,3-mannosyl-glycoprotein 2-beta-N-acetylglucosaminyltransferase n=1 Tax=Bemisia tabaci TaxID=7038 RepID=A0A9P0G624_BEMTA|nr:unnamed protein product [Bemisia tabaci]
MFKANPKILFGGVFIAISCSFFTSNFYKCWIPEFTSDFGELSNTTLISQDGRTSHIRDSASFEIKEILPNCGIPYECMNDTFPVHLYTGENKSDFPKLCVFGKYVLAEGVNGVGRGLNAAIVDPSHGEILAVHNFDTYLAPSSPTLEEWLQKMMELDDILIIFTFDEASKEFTSEAKKALFQLGSGKIQDLQYRSQWYMISQKGISGFTPYETLHNAKNGWWGEPINLQLCIPKKIVPLPITPDPFPRCNQLRASFCDTAPELICDEFCLGNNRHEPIGAALLTNKSLIGNAAYSTPIMVLCGKNESDSLSFLVMTLTSLIHQPGIQPVNVRLLHFAHQTHIPLLAKLFGFLSNVYQQSYSNQSETEMALDLAHNFYPQKKYIIIIESELILSPDFLFFMAQVLPVMEGDESIIGISAWNPYGYENLSSKKHEAYRVEYFPGLGFLMSMRIYTDYLRGNFSCCFERNFIGWSSTLKSLPGYTIIPDVSRVLRRPIAPSAASDEYQKMFTFQRETNVDVDAWIDHPHKLKSHQYFNEIVNKLLSSTTIHLSEHDISNCAREPNMAAINALRNFKGKSFVINYNETSSPGFGTLVSLLNCFDIYSPKDHRPFNLYKGLFRFSMNDNDVFLLEASSPFLRTHSLPF